MLGDAHVSCVASYSFSDDLKRIEKIQVVSSDHQYGGELDELPFFFV